MTVVHLRVTLPNQMSEHFLNGTLNTYT